MMNHADIQSTLLESLVEEYGVANPDGIIQRLSWMAQEQRLNMRLYYLNDTSAKILWESLRRDEEVLHFVMSLTIGFKLRLSLSYHDDAFNDLCGLLTSALCDLADTKVADTVFCEQLLVTRRPSMLKQLLTTNPWLVVLILIERNAAFLNEKGFFPTPSTTGE
jgi:hypothetical protein